jgi:hypothetical protein
MDMLTFETLPIAALILNLSITFATMSAYPWLPPGVAEKSNISQKFLKITGQRLPWPPVSFIWRKFPLGQ